MGNLLRQCDNLVITNAHGEQTFIDATILWAPTLHPMKELIDPGQAEKAARETKKLGYEATADGASAEVHTVCISAHGDVAGGNRALIMKLVLQRATERRRRAWT